MYRAEEEAGSTKYTKQHADATAIACIQSRSHPHGVSVICITALTVNLPRSLSSIIVLKKVQVR
jgi:hypothetical protein